LQQVESQIALGEAQEYERTRKWTQAREQYVASLKFKENAEAREGLDRVAGMEQRSVKLDAASAAYDAGNFAEALKLYEDAFAGSPIDDQVIKDRVTECRYRSGLEAADKLREAKKYTEALAANEKLRAIKPDASGVIDDREARMKIDQDYEGFMAKGNEEFAAGQWDKAIEQFGLALKKKDTGEGASRLKYTKYMQSYSKGKERMEASDYPSAASYFKIAMQYAGDEEKKQLQELIKQVEAKRKE
jgi:tetratricopeptide (TPR) repeat protein